jgi:hypothetical protein
MARIHWFIHAISASLFAAVAWHTTIATNLADAFDIRWPDYHPSPGESLALDVATRTEVDARQPGIFSRFAEFVRRALTHDEYSAGHFDPGRMPA